MIMRVRTAQNSMGLLTSRKYLVSSTNAQLAHAPNHKEITAEAPLEFGRQLYNAVSDAYHS